MSKGKKVESGGGLWKGLSKLAGDVVRTTADGVGRVDLNVLRGSARIAVVGASRSGKTVFLTSLIDHLRNHEPGQFSLEATSLSGKERARVVKFEELDVRDGLMQFPFEEFRKSLVQESQWPRKTKDTYQYRIKIHRDDSILSRFFKDTHSTYLSFLDFPGERIADAPMLASSYAEWSDAAIKALPVGGGFDELVSAFNDAAQGDDSEDAILAAYKSILAEQLLRFHTSISPSTFMLSPDGQTPSRECSKAELISERFIGLSKSDQFCPLPAGVRQKRPDLAGKFERSFEAYKRVLLLPLYEALKESDRLCILVNVPEILQSGVAAYNDHIELLRQVMAFCSPKKQAYQEVMESIYKTIGKMIIDDRYRPGGIEKVAFVGTQADRIQARDMNKLTRLVEQMQQHSTKQLPGSGLKMRSFSCVAVQATKPAGEGHLQGRLMTTTDANTPVLEEFRVSSLPDKWPSDWNPEDYQFPDVWPKFGRNLNVPPEQIGLDRVFNYLIS